MKKRKFQKAVFAFFMAVFMIGFTPAVQNGQNSSTAYAAAKIRLNQTNITLHINDGEKETCRLKVLGTDKKVKWSTANPKIAAVSQNGKVTPNKSGNTVITAKVSGKKLKCKVTVQVKAKEEDRDDANANTDTDANGENQEAATVFDRLYEAIRKNGYLNADGDYVISYKNDDNGNTFVILYKRKEGYFKFISNIMDGDFVSTMQLDKNGDGKAFFNCISMSMSTIMWFNTEAWFYPSDCLLTNNELSYKITNSVNCTDLYCSVTSDLIFDLSIVGWQVCLLKNDSDVTLEDLGFITL